MNSQGLQMCFVAAFCGSSASVVGKFAFDSQWRSLVVKSLMLDQVTLAVAEVSQFDGELLVWGVDKMAMIVLFLCMLGVNSLMLTRLVHAMNALGTVTATTVINNIAFCISGAYGKFLFGEDVPLLWWFGVVLIFCGVAVMNSDNPKSQTKSKPD